jgi:hypothetical protein
LDSLVFFVLLLALNTLVLHREFAMWPALAVAAGVFCFRYIQLRRRRDRVVPKV